jgi:hypothetical protein
MARSPNAKAKHARLLRQLEPGLRQLAAQKGCTLEVIPASGERELPLVLFRTSQGRIALEVLPAVPGWRSLTVNSYAAELNEAAKELGNTIECISDDDDGLHFQAEVKKQR